MILSGQSSIRKEEGERRKEEGGRRKEEGGRRKEEGGRRKEEGFSIIRDIPGKINICEEKFAGPASPHLVRLCGGVKHGPNNYKDTKP
jgi:hypothetical protein